MQYCMAQRICEYLWKQSFSSRAKFWCFFFQSGRVPFSFCFHVCVYLSSLCFLVLCRFCIIPFYSCQRLLSHWFGSSCVVISLTVREFSCWRHSFTERSYLQFMDFWILGGSQRCVLTMRPPFSGGFTSCANSIVWWVPRKRDGWVGW